MAAAKRRRPPQDVRIIDDDDDDKRFEGTPLFEIVGDKKPDRILVERTDPEEGTLGTCPPHWTEADIKGKWGGGTFKLQARDQKNKPMKGGFRTVVIAGDPIFESEIAERRWKRQQGVREPSAAGAATPGISDVVTLIKQQEATAKTEAQQRIEEMQKRHEMELERMRLEATNKAEERKREAEDRERERRDREDRDKRDREEREAREKREREDREERRRLEDERARIRDREFSVMLQQLGKSNSGPNPTEMLVRGIEIASKLGGGGELDPLSELAKNIPAILDSGKALVNPGAKAKPDDDKTLTLEGALGIKALQVVQHFKQQGLDPAQALSDLFDAVLKMARAAPAPAPAADQAAAAPPAAQEAPSSPAAPADDATDAGGRRARGRRRA